MPRVINQLWDFVIVDEQGDEGVLRRDTPSGTQPMIGDDYDRTVQGFGEEARRVAGEMGLPLKLVGFGRQKVEKIQ